MSDMIEERFRSLLNGMGLDSKIDADLNLYEELGIDSLDCVELLMSTEEEFGIDVPDEVAEKFYTINDVLSYLREHVKPPKQEVSDA